MTRSFQELPAYDWNHVSLLSVMALIVLETECTYLKNGVSLLLIK